MCTSGLTPARRPAEAVARLGQVPRPAPLLLILMALAAAGCGAERRGSPDSRVKEGAPSKAFVFPKVGMRFKAPVGNALRAAKKPGVFKIFLGEPVISAFAYRRREQVPKRRSELSAARRRLVGAVKERSRDYRLERSRITKVAAAPAIELLGSQTIARGRLRIRSLHVFKGRGEYVLELLAPKGEYDRANRVVFTPLLRSLKLTGKVDEPKKKAAGSKKKQKKRAEKGR